MFDKKILINSHIEANMESFRKTLRDPRAAPNDLSAKTLRDPRGAPNDLLDV